MLYSIHIYSYKFISLEKGTNHIIFKTFDSNGTQTELGQFCISPDNFFDWCNVGFHSIFLFLIHTHKKPTGFCFPATQILTSYCYYVATNHWFRKLSETKQKITRMLWSHSLWTGVFGRDCCGCTCSSSLLRYSACRDKLLQLRTWRILLAWATEFAHFDL